MNSAAFERAINLVVNERHRQIDLAAAGIIPGVCDDRHVTDLDRLAALMEEVGEVAKALIEGEDREVMTELVQVAAVAAGWAARWA